MDNDLAPSLQVRMDSASPIISLNNQQLRDKEQQLGILPPSPGVGSNSTLQTEVHTGPTSQQDDSATLSVFPHFSLCSPVPSLGDTVVVPLAAETPIPVPQSDGTHLLSKILMQPSNTQPLAQATSHSLNQQTHPVQQPQQQQSALSSRATVVSPAAAVAAAAVPTSKDDSYSKDIELMLFKTIYNTHKDPLTPSKQPGQQPLAPSAPLPAPAHTPQPQLSSVHQRDITPVGGATGTSLPMLAVAQTARVLHQGEQILPQTTVANSLGLGATSSEGGNTRGITFDDSPPSNDSVGNRSSPTGDLFQGGAVSGRKRHSFSKTPSSGRNQGFIIPTVSNVYVHFVCYVYACIYEMLSKSSRNLTCDFIHWSCLVRNP